MYWTNCFSICDISLGNGCIEWVKTVLTITEVVSWEARGEGNDTLYAVSSGWDLSFVNCTLSMGSSLVAPFGYKE